MDIACILNEFPCLSETFILNQITGLFDRGHNVNIYAAWPGNHSTVHPEIQKYDLLRHTHYYGFPGIPVNKLYRVMKSVAILASHKYQNLFSMLKTLNFLRYGRDALSLGLFYQADSFLKYQKRKYDIIQCHFGPSGVLATQLRNLSILDGKVVTSFHGYDLSAYIEKNGRSIYNDLFNHGDLFLPCSKKFKEKLISLGCPGQKVIVHHNGVDIDKYGYSARRPKEGKVQLVSVARLVPKKGLEYSIKAVANLVKRYPRLKYNIIGDGYLRDQLNFLIQRLDLSEDIQLLGAKDQNDVHRILSDSDILIAPSVTSDDGDQEGIPVALMEAMALGLPVVSSDHTAISELVQDGHSGFLVPEKDVETLTKRLDFLIGHQELWPEMGMAGRKYVEQYYNIHKLNDELVKLYDGLLGE